MTPIMLVTIIFALCLFLYFLPSFVAVSRMHNNFIPILITNFFFGATVFGWIFCVIWAFSDNTKNNKGVHYIEPI